MEVAHSTGPLRHIPVGVVTALEFVVLAPAALLVALVAIPRSFEIESSCVGPLGAVATKGDTYVAGFVALGTLGWIGVLAGVIFAGIAQRPRLMLLLPAAWFGFLVGAALVTAALVGPALCP